MKICWHAIKTYALAILLVAPGLALSLGFGKIQLYSYLNEPLDLDIEITDAEDFEINNLSVSLASAKDFSRAGLPRPFFLNQLNFSLHRFNNTTVIHVSTNSAVKNPHLEFLVQLDWPDSRIVKAYTVLIEPKSTNDLDKVEKKSIYTQAISQSAIQKFDLQKSKEIIPTQDVAPKVAAKDKELPIITKEANTVPANIENKPILVESKDAEVVMPLVESSAVVAEPHNVEQPVIAATESIDKAQDKSILRNTIDFFKVKKDNNNSSKKHDLENLESIPEEFKHNAEAVPVEDNKKPRLLNNLLSQFSKGNDKEVVISVSEIDLARQNISEQEVLLEDSNNSVDQVTSKSTLEPPAMFNNVVTPEKSVVIEPVIAPKNSTALPSVDKSLELVDNDEIDFATVARETKEIDVKNFAQGNNNEKSLQKDIVRDKQNDFVVDNNNAKVDRWLTTNKVIMGFIAVLLSAIFIWLKRRNRYEEFDDDLLDELDDDQVAELDEEIEQLEAEMISLKKQSKAIDDSDEYFEEDLIDADNTDLRKLSDIEGSDLSIDELEDISKEISALQSNIQEKQQHHHIEQQDSLIADNKEIDEKTDDEELTKIASKIEVEEAEIEEAEIEEAEIEEADSEMLMCGEEQQETSYTKEDNNITTLDAKPVEVGNDNKDEEFSSIEIIDLSLDNDDEIDQLVDEDNLLVKEALISIDDDNNDLMDFKIEEDILETSIESQDDTVSKDDESTTDDFSIFDDVVEFLDDSDIDEDFDIKYDLAKQYVDTGDIISAKDVLNELLDSLPEGVQKNKVQNLLDSL